MEWIRMLGLFFRYFELAADEEGDGSVSEQVISRGDLRSDGKLLMILELEIWGTFTLFKKLKAYEGTVDWTEEKDTRCNIDLLGRIPVGKGIAGYVAETGEALNVSDVYNDPSP